MDESPFAAAESNQAVRPPHWLAALAIAILTFAVFSPTLTYGFVYDDHAQIVETKQLNSWRMIPNYFTGHVWKWKSPNDKGVYYRAMVGPFGSPDEAAQFCGSLKTAGGQCVVQRN